jgi:hypothetical protein
VLQSVLKCHLKPINFKDYKVTFTPSEEAQLQSIFLRGVCGYSSPALASCHLRHVFEIVSNSDRVPDASDRSSIVSFSILIGAPSFG